MNHSLAHKHQRLKQRARIIQTIRAFFIDAGFLEIETPHRVPLNAPEVHITPLPSQDWQLHTSPELAMKRLLSAGYDNIFQICPCWRAEELGSRHLPEFTMLEWYRSHCDYQDLMTDCEKLFRHLLPGSTLLYQDQQVDLQHPFERLTVAEAFNLYTDTTVWQALKNDCFDELIAITIEPQLGITRPTILYDYPSELASLARRKADQPEIAERFELYVAGIELANGFSELTDPVEQRRRFKNDARIIAQRTNQPAQIPEPFLKDLQQMPPAAGIALGIDRLVMLLTNADAIDQVVAFTPQDL